MLEPPYAVLQAPIPAFEDVVEPRWRRWAPDFCRTDAGTHAHVTILAPVPVERADALAGLVAAFAPFDLTFGRLARFPDGLAYAVPEPPEPVRALMDAVARLLPDVRPYGGAHPVAPHLSIDHEPVEALADVALPRTQRVDRLELVWYEPGNTRALAGYPLRGPVPAP